MLRFITILFAILLSLNFSFAQVGNNNNTHGSMLEQYINVAREYHYYSFQIYGTEFINGKSVHFKNKSQIQIIKSPNSISGIKFESQDYIENQLLFQISNNGNKVQFFNNTTHVYKNESFTLWKSEPSDAGSVESFYYSYSTLRQVNYCQPIINTIFLSQCTWSKIWFLNSNPTVVANGAIYLEPITGQKFKSDLSSIFVAYWCNNQSIIFKLQLDKYALKNIISDIYVTTQISGAHYITSQISINYLK